MEFHLWFSACSLQMAYSSHVIFLKDFHIKLIFKLIFKADTWQQHTQPYFSSTSNFYLWKYLETCSKHDAGLIRRISLHKTKNVFPMSVTSIRI